MPLWTWGSDIYGRLGQGTEDRHLESPTEVSALSSVPLLAVACGSAHNAVLDKEGRCYTWGKCHFGQLGHGEMDQNETVPRLVGALGAVLLQSVAAGDSHVIAITRTGKVYTWGIGYYGSLGHGDETSLDVPKLVEGLKEHSIRSAAAGASHSLAVTDTGALFVWGRDHCGQLGFPASLLNIPGMKPKLVHFNHKSPVEKSLPDNSSCSAVSACSNHTLILLDNSRVVSYGCNDNGELGRVKPAEGDEETDQYVTGIEEPVMYISAGWKHCAAITASGQLYTWGHGKYGRLGLGHCKGSATPALVKFPERNPFKVISVSCGESHTVSLDDCGRVWVFGSAHYGKLGLARDPSGYVHTPTLLPLQQGVRFTDVVCGTNHSVGFKTEQ